MDDPNGPTRIYAPANSSGRAAAVPPSMGASTDPRVDDVQRAVDLDYVVLGVICDVVDGNRKGSAYLAQRRASTRIDVLVMMNPADYVDVLGTIAGAFPANGDACPNCGTPLRAGVRFCGGCRSNLTTLPLTNLPDSIGVAEFVEMKGEATRHQFEVLGQIDAMARVAHTGERDALSFVARMANTSNVFALWLERSSATVPAVLSVDVTGILTKHVESLLPKRVDRTKHVAEVIPQPIPRARAAPPVEERPARVLTPPPSSQQSTMPTWAKVAIVSAGGVALIASISLIITTTSNRKTGQTVQAALDSVRADAERKERARADSIRAASAKDSATLEIVGLGAIANATIMVDQRAVHGSVLTLSPGMHIASVVARGYTSVTDTLDIQPGKRVSWSPSLTAIAPPKRQVTRGESACGQAFVREDWRGARVACEQQADAPGGDGAAERTLGAIYEHGLGVPQNYGSAASWYSRSAAHNDALGEYRYGLLLRDGKGVSDDKGRAFELFRTSANKGVLDAQFAAGDALEHGIGVAQNSSDAARWYRKAADRGLSDAQFALGLLYERGDGVDRSIPDATRWMLKAVAQGNDRAKQELTRLGVKW